jgi:hypothetical protein
MDFRINNMKRILIIILCFTNLIAFSQSILVNNQSVNVSSEVTFPYWLDSTSTLSIDTNVISISVLEFNIVPTQNGNSLVYVQTKVVTTVETVPNGNTWKVTGVLIDPLFTQSNNSNGGTIIINGGGSDRPVALSSQQYQATLGQAMIFCDTLVSPNTDYDNWVLPTIDELIYIASGGGLVPGNRTDVFLWSISPTTGYSSIRYYQVLNLLTGEKSKAYETGSYNFRCVRHEAISVNGSGSGGGLSSGGSGNIVSSGITPIAISTESANTMNFADAMLYCDSLVEDGFNDWVMPTLDDMTFISSGGCVIPDARTENYIFTRSMITAGSSAHYHYTIKLKNTAGPSSGIPTISNQSNSLANLSKTRCVRRGAISVSGSGGSGTPSTLGAGMPTMISNESSNQMRFGNCQIYCENLSESGHNDWIIPTIDQLTYASSGGCVIAGGRSDNWFWSRTNHDYDAMLILRFTQPGSNTGEAQLNSFGTNNTPSQLTHPYFPKCRCVR